MLVVLRSVVRSFVRAFEEKMVVAVKDDTGRRTLRSASSALQ